MATAALLTGIALLGAALVASFTAQDGDSYVRKRVMSFVLMVIGLLLASAGTVMLTAS